MVAVISVDAYPWFGILRPDMSPWGYKNMFPGCTVLPDSNKTKLGSSNQEASPSTGKNTGVVLVPCSCMEVHPYSYFQWCGYFWGPWVSFVTTNYGHKLNEFWPYYQKDVNQITLKNKTH